MVTTTNFDSEFCGSLPIDHINTIQPHGAVLLIGKTALAIIQASDNIGDYLGIAVRDLVGKPLTAYLPAQPEAAVRAMLEKEQQILRPFAPVLRTAS